MYKAPRVVVGGDAQFVVGHCESVGQELNLTHDRMKNQVNPKRCKGCQ